VGDILLLLFLIQSLFWLALFARSAVLDDDRNEGAAALAFVHGKM
jgi:hypothetical protein